MDWLTEPFGAGNIDWAAVPLRIALGVIFVDAGWGKWHRGIHGTGDWLREMGLLFNWQPMKTSLMARS